MIEKDLTWLSKSTGGYALNPANMESVALIGELE